MWIEGGLAKVNRLLRSRCANPRIRGRYLGFVNHRLSRPCPLSSRSTRRVLRMNTAYARGWFDVGHGAAKAVPPRPTDQLWSGQGGSRTEPVWPGRPSAREDGPH